MVYAPGSLYTSVLPVLCVTGLRDAIVATSAQVVQVANLRPQVPETVRDGLADHLAAVLAHGARVDCFLHDTGDGLPVDPDRLAGSRGGGRGRRRSPGPTGSRTTINSWHGPSVLCCSQPISTWRCGGVQWRFV